MSLSEWRGQLRSLSARHSVIEQQGPELRAETFFGGDCPCDGGLIDEGGVCQPAPTRMASPATAEAPERPSPHRTATTKATETPTDVPNTTTEAPATPPPRRKRRSRGKRE